MRAVYKLCLIQSAMCEIAFFTHGANEEEVTVHTLAPDSYELSEYSLHSGDPLANHLLNDQGYESESKTKLGWVHPSLHTFDEENTIVAYTELDPNSVCSVLLYSLQQGALIARILGA